MELFFGEFIKQLIAAILAIFMPFSSLTPAIAEHAKGQISITTPSVYEQRAEEAEAVAEWDISGTEYSDVTMTYYDTEDQSLINTITSSITSLFAPVTAYAAEEQENAKTYKDGTVVITGTGATESYIFLNWLDADKFVPYYEDWCANNNIREGSYYAERDGIDKNGMIVGNMASAEEAHNVFENYTDMISWYIPVNVMDCIASTPDFWENYATFNPKHIIIQDNVTTIAFAAFAFCTNVQDVEITSAVKTIETGAFSSTGITSVKFPATLTTLGQSVFARCEDLTEVYLPYGLEKIGNYTFNDMPDDSTIYCQTEDVAALLASLNANTYSRAALPSDCNNNFNHNVNVTVNADLFKSTEGVGNGDVVTVNPNPWFTDDDF